MSKIGIQSSKKHPSNFPILNFCIWKPGCFPFIPFYIPFIPPLLLGTLGTSPTQPIHRGHSERLFQELAPTFALVQRRIGKDSQGVPAVRQGSFSGWWVELATPGSSPKIGNTQTLNLIDHGRKPRLLGLTLFIEKDMAHTFYHWCFYRYLFCTLLGWPVRKSVRVEIEDLDKQLSALFLNG